MTVDVSRLARSRSLTLPGGFALDTPLLIPSFSSRGFPFTGSPGAKVSQLSEVLEVAKDWITEVLLVSAYDLFYGHMPGREALTTHPEGDPYGAPQLVLIDSGCYEANEHVELPDVRRAAIEIQDWTRDLHKQVLDGCHADLPLAIVSYDSHEGIGEQIARARELFDRYPAFLHDFLLKPEGEATHIKPEVIAASAERLRGFDIIGMTEKELGSSLLDRMTTIARVRTALDDARVDVPLHIFGSLDPILSPLYFIAGAEIFDGLSWLYMAYHEGVAVYSEAAAALGGHWSDKPARRQGIQLNNNLTAITDLSLAMQRFLSSGRDFAQLGQHAEVFRRGADNLVARVERPR